jgi:hypothetical protein
MRALVGRVALVGVTGLAALAGPRTARAADAQCAPAYEGAQLLRQRGKLVEARDAALACARATCPEIARKDCATWVAEIERATPTVIVIAREAGGGGEARVRVLVDRAVRAEAGSGRAFALDPGGHVFRVERDGDPPIEQTITIVQGEHDRPLRFNLRPRATSSPEVEPASGAAHARVESAGGAGRASVTYVPAAIVSGAAALSLGAATWLGLSGRSDLSHLRATCAPGCSDAQVDPVRARLLASDVTLAAGLVGTAIAIYLWVRPPATAATAAAANNGFRVEIAPLRLGGALTLRRAF